jgi:zinc protease
MLGLAFSEEKLAIQKKVVVEEFMQSYLNQPYGDTWMLLRPLAYRHHPYRWSTIGESIDHIRKADLQQVQDFFHTHYHPGNAILSVSGNMEADKVFRLAEKWFGDLPGRPRIKRDLPAEPIQAEERRLVVERDVPSSQVYLAFQCPERGHPDFFPTDLLSDLLANGESSRLVHKLVKEEKVFSEVNAYLTGSLDPGLFVVHAKLHDGVTAGQAEEALWGTLHEIRLQEPGAMEFEKVKNKVEAAHTFSESHALARAINLGYYELMGDADQLNQLMDNYNKVQPGQVQEMATNLFRPENASVLHYLAVDSK